jgi:hypothetical protein
MLAIASTRPRLLVERLDAHLAHQRHHMLATDHEAFAPQQIAKHAAAGEPVLEVPPVDLSHRRQVAEAADRNATTLYRTLSRRGNPELRSLAVILQAMGPAHPDPAATGNTPVMTARWVAPTGSGLLLAPDGWSAIIPS